MRYPAPGTYIDIGGRELHAIIEGEGPVTVLFDSGELAGSTQWRHVQPELAKTSKTIAYDRAGIGWSSNADRFTSEQIADDMFALLQALEQQDPVVLVGHSMGGKNIRAFAQKYPHMVRAIVFVDHTITMKWEHIAEQFPDIEPMLPVIEEQNTGMIDKIGQFLPKLYFGLHRFDRSLYPMPLPEPGDPRLDRSMPQADAWRTMAGYLTHNQESFEFLDGFRSLANVPITVITRGKAEDPTEKKLVLGLQAQIVASSNNSRQVIAENSGHDVPDDQPEIIIEAVLEVIARTD